MNPQHDTIFKISGYVMFTFVYTLIGAWAKVDTDGIRLVACSFTLAVLTMIGITLYIIPMVRLYVRQEILKFEEAYDD